VLLSEVNSEVVISVIVVIIAVSITEMTEVMITSQMLEQMIWVEEPDVTELTERMPTMGSVILVTLPLMIG